MEEFIEQEVIPHQHSHRKTIPGWARILILIIPYIIVIATFELIGHYLAGFKLNELASTMGTPTQMLITQFFNFLGTALVLFLMMKIVDREKFVNLGFQTKGRMPDTVTGILLGLLAMGLGFFILRAAGNLTVSGVDFDFREFLLLLLIFALVAVAEEMLMRGYILKNLMLSMNKYAALAVSSLMFALMHVANPNFSWLGFWGILLAGIALGATYIYTRNLWFPIAYHFSWNFFQSLFGFNVSGIDVYSVLTIAPQGEEHISGGSFGFEGSVLSLAFQVILFTAIILLYEKRRFSISN